MGGERTTPPEMTGPTEMTGLTAATGPDAAVTPEARPRGQHAARRRTPQQARAHATVDAILEAAAAVFRAVGREKATTQAIADGAGIAIGSLYQYFPDKDALARALAERHEAAFDAHLQAAASADADLAATVGAWVDAVIGVHEADPALLAGLLERHRDDLAGVDRALARHDPPASSGPAAAPAAGRAWALAWMTDGLLRGNASGPRYRPRRLREECVRIGVACASGWSAVAAPTARSGTHAGSQPDARGGPRRRVTARRPG